MCKGRDSEANRNVRGGKWDMGTSKERLTSSSTRARKTLRIIRILDQANATRHASCGACPAYASTLTIDGRLRGHGGDKSESEKELHDGQKRNVGALEEQLYVQRNGRERNEVESKEENKEKSFEL